MPQATAVESGSYIEFHIAELPLAQALDKLIKQAKIQLLFESSLVDNLTSHELNGSYSIEEALAFLLKGTQLRFKRINRSMFIVYKTSGKVASIYNDSTESKNARALSLTKKAQLPEIVIVGETHHAISIQEPSTATKVYVPTMEVPRSLEGIDANLFRDRGNATLAEAFRDYSSINITDQSGLINLRGFRVNDQSILKAGLPSISRGITPLPLQNIEGIEVAKGANSSLYGYGQPGGVINLIPKAPLPHPFTNLSVSYGNYDHYFAVDANNPWELSENLSQRFNVLIRQEREHNNVDGSIKQIQVTPAFVYQMEENKTLSFNIEYNHQEIDGLGGKRVFDKALPEWQPALDLLFPDLIEVPFYPYNGSDAKDLQKSDSVDLWMRFKAPLNNAWDYSIAAYGGRSDIDIRANVDYTIWFTPFLGFSNVDTINLLYEALNRDTYQSNFGALKTKFKDKFFATYGNLLDENENIVHAIYGESTTPSWSDELFRTYQSVLDIFQNARQHGFEFNLHGVKDFMHTTHDMVFGLSYLERQWQYESLFLYNSELYNRGNDFLAAGDLVTGFALRRQSKISWYYPYGPAVNTLNIILPDQIATQANLPVGAQYQLDARQRYYSGEELTKSLGLYLQDHISIDDDWRLLFTSGFYRYQRNFYNNLVNAGGWLTGDNWFLEELDLSYIDSSVSPQLGVVYLPTDDFSIFASTGKQFDIVNGLQTGNSPAQPEKTTANEVGVKWWPLEEFNVSSSLFQITKENFAIPGDANTGFANIHQDGSIQSTGAEINMIGFITPHIKLSTNYSKIKATSEENSGVSDGLLRALLKGIPQRNGSLWLQYHTQPYGKRGWSIGAGTSYVGKRVYELQQITADLPSYTLIDTSIAFKNDDFRVALNVDNITNKQWLAGASPKATGIPEVANLATQITAFHVGLGYGTRVRLTTELFF